MIQIPSNFTGDFQGCSSWEHHGEVFKQIIEKVNPKNILEIGFFRGSSSFMWLHLSQANVLSIDPMQDVEFPLNPRKHDGAPENADKLKELSPGRFNLLKLDSRFAYPFIKDTNLDLIFIDGSHFASFVRSDIELALKLKVPYIVLDDFHDDVSDVFFHEYFDKFDIIEVFNTQLLESNGKNKICFAKLKE